jgi:hypothetical protein
MGWRDINMNRRKPPLRLAVVPAVEGEEPSAAVRRKAAAAARSALEAQQGTAAEVQGVFRFFDAGYLAGFARHQALKHGVDPEADVPPMQSMLRDLAAVSPPSLAVVVDALAFWPCGTPSSRAALRAEEPSADAGYLAGHLDSLCGTAKLRAAALAAADADGFLTACDIAADPMQTRQPTLSLRFDAAERARVRRGFASLRA